MSRPCRDEINYSDKEQRRLAGEFSAGDWSERRKGRDLEGKEGKKRAYLQELVYIVKEDKREKQERVERTVTIEFSNLTTM